MNSNENCMNCKNAKKDLFAYLHKYLKYNSGFYNLVFPMLEVRKLKKKEVILKEGEVCKQIFWLQSGSGRYFRRATDENGFEYEETIDFCKPGKIVFMGESFFSEEPSKISFELSAEAVIIPFSKECYEYMSLKRREVLKIINRILASKSEYEMTKNYYLKLKPRNRYQEFLAVFGVEIEQGFKIKQIAVHLALRPSFLSRLRGEYGRKKNGLTKYLQTVFLILQFM